MKISRRGTRKAIVSIFLFLSFWHCSSMVAMAQDFRSLQGKAESAVKTKRPDWKLIHKIEYEKMVSYSWGSVRRGIGLSIFYGASVEEATEKMEFKNNIISVGPGKKRTDFGDEAYSWKSGRGDFAGIRFRKANVYIEVTAPTMAMAEDLARSLAKEIRKK